MNDIIITIDGPAGSGKTSLAELIAKKYNLLHIRGGTYFRSLTYGIIKSNIDFNNQDLVIEYAKNMDLKLNNNQILLNNINITNKIYSNDINNIITLISNYNKIRTLRKQWIIKIKDNHNIIADGRTLGSEIFPKAKLKFYLTSDIKLRAKRKNRTLNDEDLNITLDLIKKRDLQDTNSIYKKMEIPANAIIIDSSILSIAETLYLFSKYINKAFNL